MKTKFCYIKIHNSFQGLGTPIIKIRFFLKGHFAVYKKKLAVQVQQKAIVYCLDYARCSLNLCHMIYNYSVWACHRNSTVYV